ncbi:MAG TPA: hypothetical protein V6D08_08045 [Candidatus Obscuribacterales bacterium]
MSPLRQVEAPGPTDLDGLETLLDLVFPSAVAGPVPPSLEVRERASQPDRSADTLDELRLRLDFACAELRDTKQRLQAANYRLGYLEALLCSKEAELNSLNVSLRRSWWTSIARLLRHRQK